MDVAVVARIYHFQATAKTHYNHIRDQELIKSSKLAATSLIFRHLT